MDQINIDTLTFDEKGLIPAIVQDYQTGEVLTLAYMNRESLQISLEEKRTCFYSRSRQKLWRKGETSGNTQQIINIIADCDRDALVVEVVKAGPACHTGTDSCFMESVYNAYNSPNSTKRFHMEQFGMGELYKLLIDRKDHQKEGSYTTYLFEKGDDKILKKVGEESTEVIIAAKNNDNEELVYELADLAYHAMVLMVQKGITLEDVKSELAGRHVVDKKVKQERMGGKE